GAALIGAVPFASSEWLPALIESHWFLPLLYFALMIFHQGVRVGRKTYLVNLGSGNQRTRYVAVSNTLIGVILLLMSFTGLLGEWLSLEGLILAFSVMGVAGVAMTRSLPDV
ncbi:MAG: MFS transporter, partial [Oceanobacter sp.]